MSWTHFRRLTLSSTALPLCFALGVAALPMANAQTNNPEATSLSDEKVGTDQVLLDADRVQQNSDANEIIATGNVVITYADRVLRADEVTYDTITGQVRAAGNVSILDPDGSVRYADEIVIDENLENGTARNFFTRMPGGALAGAAVAVREEGSINRLERTVYTACVICEETGNRPTWQLRARSAVQNQQTQMITYRDAILEVGGVPVFYVPYFSHPDPTSTKRSGLLAPDIGLSDKLGAYYEQPYYWAIDESQDIVIAPWVMSKQNPVLSLDYRKQFYSGKIRLEGSATYNQEFDSDGERFGDEEWRGHIFAEGRFKLSNDWEWGFGAEHVSDDLYLRRYSITGERTTRGLFASSPLVLSNQVFLTGQGDSYFSETSFINFQDLRGGINDDNLIKSLPYSFSEMNFDLGAWGSAAVNVSASLAQRKTGRDSNRISIGGDWANMSIIGPGIVLNPFVEARYDVYKLSDAAGTETDVERGLAVAGATLSYPFIRRGTSVDVLITPKVMTAWGTSGANEDGVFFEDSPVLELGNGSIFAPTAVTGYDRWDGGGRMAIGVSASALWRNGFRLSGEIGQRYFETADTAFDPLSNLDGTSSDILAAVGFSYLGRLSINVKARFDDEDYSLVRTEVSSDISLGRFRGLVEYFKTEPEVSLNLQAQEGLYFQGEYRITDNVSTLFTTRTNIAEDINLNQGFGFAYFDDCTRFELVYTRSEARDRSLGPSESIQFRMVLRSLGELGSSTFD